MLNPFPIQFLSLIAFFLLRVMLGIILVRMGIRTVHNSHKGETPLTHTERSLLWCLGTVEIISGALFVIGLYTQIAALVTIGVAITFGVLRKKIVSFHFPEQSFILLIAVSACSLFITGAGILAFDLPI